LKKKKERRWVRRRKHKWSSEWREDGIASLKGDMLRAQKKNQIICSATNVEDVKWCVIRQNCSTTYQRINKIHHFLPEAEPFFVLAASNFGLLSSDALHSACSPSLAFFFCFRPFSLIFSHCDSFVESCLFLFLPCSEPEI